MADGTDETPFAEFQTLSDSAADAAEGTAGAGEGDNDANTADNADDTAGDEATGDQDTLTGADADDGDDATGNDDGDDTGGDNAGTADGDDETGEGAGEGADTPPKKKNRRSAGERIAELTKAKHEAIRSSDARDAENADLRARLEKLEKKLTSDDGGGTGEGKPDDGRPDPEKFEYGEMDAGYQDALMDWKVEQGLKKRDDADAAKATQESRTAQTAALTKSYDEKIVAGATAYDDFETVVIQAADNGDYPLTADTAAMILDSDVGHHVAYKIASDLKLAKKLAQMTPAQQGQQFNRIEAQFTSKDAKSKNRKTSKAPKPPRSHATGQGSPKKIDATTNDFAAFEKAAMAELQRKK